jgi:ABC-2 type transport system permease protein
LSSEPVALPSPQLVRRPSALGGSVREFVDLVWLLAVTDFRRRFAQTALGRVWVLLGPLLFFGAVYLFVSEIIQRFVGVVPNYGVLLLMNLAFYSFFRSGVGGAMTSLTSRGGLVRKMPMPRLALPAAVLLSASFVMLSNLVVAVAWMLVTGVGPLWTWLLAPVLIVWLAVITGALGLLVSGAYVFVRDVGQIWPVIARITFYMTPLIYPIQVVRAQILSTALSYNPLSPLFAQAQVWIVNPGQPGWFEAKGTGLLAFMPFIILAVIAVAGAVVFSKGARRAAERL